MRYLLATLCIFILLNSAIANQCELNVTRTPEAELVLSTGDVRRLTGGGTFDSPVSTYRVGGEVYWFLPNVRKRKSKIFVNHTVLKGSELSEAKLVGTYGQGMLFRTSPYAPTPARGLKWITNTYQNKHGVLAFVHAEYAGQGDYWGMPCMTAGTEEVCGPGSSRIGLAWMETPPDFGGVPRFVFLGYIAAFAASRPHFNVQGTPYTVTQENGVEYLNIWFADANAAGEGMHVAWARSRLEDVIAAARAGRTTKWIKYNNGAWEDALSGRSSSALPQIPELAWFDTRVAEGRVLIHSDVVKHTQTGRYFLSAYTLESDVAPSSFVFYDSCDGANWSFNSMSNSIRHGRAKIGWSYMSFMDDNAVDNGLASGQFMLLAGYFHASGMRDVAKFTVKPTGDCSCTI